MNRHNTVTDTDRRPAHQSLHHTVRIRVCCEWWTVVCTSFPCSVSVSCLSFRGLTIIQVTRLRSRRLRSVLRGLTAHPCLLLSGICGYFLAALLQGPLVRHSRAVASMYFTKHPPARLSSGTALTVLLLSMQCVLPTITSTTSMYMGSHILAYTLAT